MELGFERPTPGQGIAIGLLALGAFAVPWLADAAIERIGVSATASGLLAATLLAMALRFAAERRGARIVAQNAGALVLLAVAAASGERAYLQLFPALVNAYLAVIFVASLATEESIVERGARILQPYLPPFTGGYCRKVSLFWAAFFAVNTVVIGVLAFGPREVWVEYCVVRYPLSVVVLSVLEFGVRKLWFRNYGRGPLDRLLARLLPAAATERGRRSQQFVDALHAAGYGPGGARRGEPLDPAVIPESSRS